MNPPTVVFHEFVTVTRAVPIPMRDGVRLTADIYRPRGVDTPLPVLLMRLPYGRAIASTVTYKHPSWYAMQGFIVVIQDVRGCGLSEGNFYPFRHEYEDGYDTVAWCVQELPGSNRRVGMYGFSYQGVTQFQAAVMQPPGLVTICPAMATADLYHGWFYWGGMPCWEFLLTWGLQLTQNRAQYLGDEPKSIATFAAQQRLPELLQTLPMLAVEPVDGFYYDWLEERDPQSPYWQQLNPIARFDAYDLPALHVAGWYDLFVEATWHTHERSLAATAQPQHLVIGPWQHMPWIPQVGDVNFGPEASSAIDTYQVDWFNFWLKGIDNGITGRSPRHFFAMGPNQWHQPAAAPVITLHLHSDATLSAEPPHPAPPDIYVFDPRIPNPSTAYAPLDQQPTHRRWDYLLYASAVLPAELWIAGVATLTLHATSDAPEPCWVVKLLDLFPGDRQQLITMGILQTNQCPVPLSFRPTDYVVPAGHRLGLAIASAAFPLVARTANPRATVSDLRESTQQVHYHAPSTLRLPKQLGKT
ncbi:MAG: CocE/NonD family hydrolase [Oscillatoriales cyanobacterium SM2_2_1]|nr:CocE/NonD family hydrolase [Oscillatoriales cyanobacterium SM2_2_1]